MKFRVTFKDPDTLGDAIREAVTGEVAAMQLANTEERDALIDIRVRRVGEQVGKWFHYGEYVTVELDTDAGTATVIADD